MKNYLFLFIAATVVFPFYGFAQHNSSVSANSEKKNILSMVETTDNDELIIVSYRVVETINSPFGSNTTSYNVSDLSLISKNDLGPNNTRTITPKYGKPKHKAPSTTELSKISFNTNINTEPLTKVETVTPPVKKLEFIMIDILSTYERILDKGNYKSVEMLKKVGDMRYFKGNLILAHKWYSQLFSLTTDLEAAYYYRYAQALRSVKQTEKANEMMSLFEKMKLLNTFSKILPENKP